MARIDLQSVAQPPRAGGALGDIRSLAGPVDGPRLGRKEGQESFGKVLKEMLSATNELQLESDRKTREFLVGETRDVHETMIAMEKAGIAFRFVQSVRNRAIEAYREIIRMQM